MAQEEPEEGDQGRGAEVHQHAQHQRWVQQSVKQCANLFVSEKNPKDEDGQDAALAQLIADSTEKKFKLNSLFKGMWKKKHYSFDLS